MPVHMYEELGSDSKEKESMDDDRRCGKSLDYKINVNIPDFYGGMHVKEIVYWISMVIILRVCRDSSREVD